MSVGKLFTIAALVVSVSVIASCAVKKNAPPAAPFVQAYSARGVVIELPPDGRTAVIQHEEIPGYMMAMTMPFPVKDTNELSGVHPGDTVSFQLIVAQTNGWISQIKILSSAPPPAVTDTSNILPAGAPLRVVRDVEPLNVGDAMPDYSFTNEFGQAVSFSQFKGEVIAVTFIFTRCPFPNFCPQMSRNFADTQEKLKSLTNAPANWHLFTLSFDPDYDAPAILKNYAQLYRADPAHWSFLTGALIDVTALTEQFGVQFWRANPGEPISHNLRTVVVNTQGRVHKIIANNNWNSDELVAEILKAAAK